MSILLQQDFAVDHLPPPDYPDLTCIHKTATQLRLLPKLYLEPGIGGNS